MVEHKYRTSPILATFGGDGGRDQRDNGGRGGNDWLENTVAASTSATCEFHKKLTSKMKRG
jgi:hypothetical protein